MKKRRREASMLPQLEAALTTAAAAQVSESSRGFGRRLATAKASRFAAAGLACLAFGGTAMATGIWNPPIGTKEIYGPVTTSNTPVPAGLSEALGVLRRDPTPLDHSAEVEATLAEVAFADGVRPDSVRFLAASGHGEATILLSAEKAVLDFEGDHSEPVCVFRPWVDGHGHSDNAQSNCIGLGELLSGRGYGESMDAVAHTGLAYGLVPDGVATVTAEFPNAPDVTVPVADNYFEIPLSGSEIGDYVEETGPNATGDSLRELGIKRVLWRDADGAVVPQHPDPHGETGAPAWDEARIPTNVGN